MSPHGLVRIDAHERIYLWTVVNLVKKISIFRVEFRNLTSSGRKKAKMDLNVGFLCVKEFIQMQAMFSIMKPKCFSKALNTTVETQYKEILFTKLLI